MYKRKYSVAGVIAGILALILIVVGVLTCIPETRTKMADYVADKFSPAYAEIKNDNAKKDSQINNLNNEINNLNKTILEKDASIEEKNIAIAEKDSLISSQTEQLNTCNANIKTLSSQKVTLLTAVSEIDNKINSTIDSVELEDLETRKTAILAQIDTLNTQISTLQAQKTQLEQDIATLQQEKATLQAEVNQLKQDKAELQNQVNSLTAQLEQYSQITVNIDTTNTIESISISDTKMNTTYTLGDTTISTLNLMPYQTATITYKQAENTVIKATIDGIEQENNVAIIIPAGANISVSAIDNTPVSLESTWQLKDSMYDLAGGAIYAPDMTITCDGTEYKGLMIYTDCIKIGNLVVYGTSNGETSWVDEKYKTITLSEEPLSSLKFFLDRNATRISPESTTIISSENKSDYIYKYKLNQCSANFERETDAIVFYFQTNVLFDDVIYTGLSMDFMIGPKMSLTNGSGDKYLFDNGWLVDTQIIAFKTEPTGDLLSFLQANATQVAE